MPEVIDHELPAVLRRARKARGLTQPQAAEWIGIAVRQYKGWELAECRPCRFIAARVVKFCQVPRSRAANARHHAVQRVANGNGLRHSGTNGTPDRVESIETNGNVGHA